MHCQATYNPIGKVQMGAHDFQIMWGFWIRKINLTD